MKAGSLPSCGATSSPQTSREETTNPFSGTGPFAWAQTFLPGPRMLIGPGALKTIKDAGSGLVGNLICKPEEFVLLLRREAEQHGPAIL